MTRTTVLSAIGLAAVVVAILAPAAGWGKAVEPKAADAGKASTQVLRVDFWHLWQASGAELYSELCASCHGTRGAGNGPSARSLKVPPPVLTQLQQAGIPREHWAYTLNSPCEDIRQRTGHAHETMPCWRQHFRQALGNDAAPLLVTRKLVDYLASIQQ